jgi:hypothetical protein
MKPGAEKGKLPIKPNGKQPNNKSVPVLPVINKSVPVLPVINKPTPAINKSIPIINKATSVKKLQTLKPKLAKRIKKL